MITGVEESSSSLEVVESMMDGTTSTKPNKALSKTNKNDNKRLKMSNGKEKSEGDGGDDDCTDEEDEDEEEEECCDVEAWDTLSTSFKKVQTVLDKNRELIQRVNENHRSKIPDNISKNVALIREINGNISKVISIYSDLSVDFAKIVSQRKKKKKRRMMEEDDDCCHVENSDG